MQITTLPVYSKLANDADLPAELRKCLPAGWQLSQHQYETYQALSDPHLDIDVVINTAMTGDGKSLAAYLPTLILPDHRAFGMYPTIELSRDQERQFASYRQDFERTSLRYDSIWGARLGELVDASSDFKRRGEVLAERFDNYHVLLTNPDIFNLVMNYRYDSGLFSSQELPYSLATNFQSFIFDEFHIFSMPQIVAALTAMVFFRCYRGNDWERPRFLFSSATTDDTLVRMIERSGLNCRVISGTYTNTPTPGYRHVLHQATLSIHRCAEREDTEAWIEAHLDLITSHWEGAQGRRPKGVIIVNSVAAARRIASLLTRTLTRTHGISVGENSGLVDDERRRAALHACDIVVGTSTIDIGVDFDISFLIFEALDAGSFLQRLGRLGRVRRNGTPFDRYEAHALISGKTPWLYARLKDALEQQGIHDGTVADRATALREAVRAAFPQATNFQRYAKRWGVLQAAHVIATLEDRSREGAFASLVQTLRERYMRMFDLKTFDNAMKHYWALAPTKRKKEQDPDAWEEGRYICDEILGFRGSSPFQVGLWDTSVKPAAFLTYDAFTLLQSATYTVVPSETYLAASSDILRLDQQRSLEEKLRHVMCGKGDKPLVLKVEQFNAEREMLKLTISGVDIRCNTQKVIVVSQFAVVEPRSPALADFNAVLKRQMLVCYISPIDAAELRMRLRLPAFFPLYRLVDIRNSREYTIAFGKAALLLEAEALIIRDKDPDNTPIIH